MFDVDIISKLALHHVGTYFTLEIQSTICYLALYLGLQNLTRKYSSKIPNWNECLEFRQDKMKRKIQFFLH